MLSKVRALTWHWRRRPRFVWSKGKYVGDESLIHNRESRRIREGERTGDVGLSEVQPFSRWSLHWSLPTFHKALWIDCEQLVGSLCWERWERSVQPVRTAGADSFPRPARPARSWWNVSGGCSRPPHCTVTPLLFLPQVRDDNKVRGSHDRYTVTGSYKGSGGWRHSNLSCPSWPRPARSTPIGNVWNVELVTDWAPRACPVGRDMAGPDQPVRHWVRHLVSHIVRVSPELFVRTEPSHNSLADDKQPTWPRFVGPRLLEIKAEDFQDFRNFYWWRKIWRTIFMSRIYRIFECRLLTNWTCRLKSKRS